MKRKAAAPYKNKPFKKPRLNPAASQFGVTNRKSSEKKDYTVVTATTIVASQTTSERNSIYSPDQGVLPTERVGRSVINMSLTWRWYGSYAPTTAGASPIRLVIVYDRQPNAALPLRTDVFDVDAIGTFMNLNNSKRFLVLVNCEETLSSAGPTSFIKSGHVSFKKRFGGGLPSEFNSVNGGTIADITTGSFIAFTWQNGNIITANPTTALYTRIRFIDN